MVTSAAKAFNLAGLKAGLIVGGPASRAQVKRLPDSVGYGGSHLGVIGHAAAYRSDPSWLDAVNANIATNRVLLADLLAERLPGVRYRIPAATYLAWLDLRGVGLGNDPAESCSSAAASPSRRVARSGAAASGTPGSTSHAPGRCSPRPSTGWRSPLRPTARVGDGAGG